MRKICHINERLKALDLFIQQQARYTIQSVSRNASPSQTKSPLPIEEQVRLRTPIESPYSWHGPWTDDVGITYGAKGALCLRAVQLFGLIIASQDGPSPFTEAIAKAQYRTVALFLHF